MAWEGGGPMGEPGGVFVAGGVDEPVWFVTGAPIADAGLAAPPVRDVLLVVPGVGDGGVAG